MGERKQRVTYFYDGARTRKPPALAAAGRCIPVGPASGAHARRSAPAGDYTGFYYGADHPMKPQRLSMTHSLILGYGLHNKLDVYVRRAGGASGEHGRAQVVAAERCSTRQAPHRAALQAWTAAAAARCQPSRPSPKLHQCSSRSRSSNNHAPQTPHTSAPDVPAPHHPACARSGRAGRSTRSCAPSTARSM